MALLYTNHATKAGIVKENPTQAFRMFSGLATRLDRRRNSMHIAARTQNTFKAYCHRSAKICGAISSAIEVARNPEPIKIAVIGISCRSNSGEFEASTMAGCLSLIRFCSQNIEAISKKLSQIEAR